MRSDLRCRGLSGGGSAPQLGERLAPVEDRQRSTDAQMDLGSVVRTDVVAEVSILLRQGRSRKIFASPVGSTGADYGRLKRRRI